MIKVCFQGKQFNIRMIQVYAATTNGKEDEVEWFCDDLQDLLELVAKKKKKPFSSQRLDHKSKTSRVTQSNKQVWPWNTKYSRAKTSRALPRD